MDEEEKNKARQRDGEVWRLYVLVLILLAVVIYLAIGWIQSEKQHYADDFGYEYSMWLMPEEPQGDFEVYG